MSDKSKAGFEGTIVQLLAASPKNSSKADPVKAWVKTAFGMNASVARITEDKQLGNRITEQFAHKEPVVIFVLEPKVNCSSLSIKVNQRRYPKLEAVLLMRNNVGGALTYEKLLINGSSVFSLWAEQTLGVNTEVFSGTPQSDSHEGDSSWQSITYGAPGTGKSFLTDQETKDKLTFRTTFHPDSDYATVVGSYKPTKVIDPYETVVKVGTQNGGNIIQQDRLVRKSEISYDFVPQAFIRAYVAAWKKYAARLAAGGALTDDDRVYLVIEEINRGHCAQIFGDLFQLLDRSETGFSDYPIDADVDLAKWLHAQFAADDFGDEFRAIKGYEEDGKLVLKLCLPPNLFIRATMNTSDQSLFPMDSAFKRRWDWRYVPISEPDTDDEPDFNKRKVLCKLGGENKLERRFDWWEFLKVINAAILNATKSEDKQLGYFFVKVPNNPGEISAEKFAGKVLFYLYNDVFKDYNYPDAVFAKKNQPAGGPKVKYSFKDFFDAKGRAKDAMVAEFLENLGIPSEDKQLPA